MSQGAQRPTSGVRFALTRAEESASLVVYRGFAHVPEADLPLSVEVDLPGGATRATLPGGPPALEKAAVAAMEKAAAALVRSATKTAAAGGAALPRKIVRWRG